MLDDPPAGAGRLLQQLDRVAEPSVRDAPGPAAAAAADPHRARCRGPGSPVRRRSHATTSALPSRACHGQTPRADRPASADGKVGAPRRHVAPAAAARSAGSKEPSPSITATSSCGRAASSPACTAAPYPGAARRPRARRARRRPRRSRRVEPLSTTITANSDGTSAAEPRSAAASSRHGSTRSQVGSMCLNGRSADAGRCGPELLRLGDAPPALPDRCRAAYASASDARAAGPVWASTLLLIAARVGLPLVTGWDTATRRDPFGSFRRCTGSGGPAGDAAPLLPWRRRASTWWYAAERSPAAAVARLLLASYVVGAGAGCSRSRSSTGRRGSTRVARQPVRVPAHRPGGRRRRRDARRVRRPDPATTPTDNWPTHVAGHPPGALLFFVGLVRLGLGGDLRGGRWSSPRSPRRRRARSWSPCACSVPRSAPGRRRRSWCSRRPRSSWRCRPTRCSPRSPRGDWRRWPRGDERGARSPGRLVGPRGLLLGGCVLLSYGLPLLGLLAVAVLWPPGRGGPCRSRPVGARGGARRSPRCGLRLVGGLPGAARALLGRRGLPTRPASYWLWGNLAALALCAGPLLGAGPGAAAPARRPPTAWLLLVGAAALSVVLADRRG